MADETYLLLQSMHTYLESLEQSTWSWSPAGLGQVSGATVCIGLNSRDSCLPHHSSKLATSKHVNSPLTLYLCLSMIC